MRNRLPVATDRLSEVRRICPPPSPNDPSIRIMIFFSFLATIQEEDHEPNFLPFYANDLAKSVDNLHQIRLSRHYSIDRLVRRWGFVDHILVLPAFHTFGHSHVILYCKSALGFIARHRAPGAMTATAEALRVALATNDIGPRSHTSGNDPHIAFARPDRTLA